MADSDFSLVGFKHCPDCGKRKPLEGFGVDKTKSDGRGYRCKECLKIYNQRYYQANKKQVITNNVARVKGKNDAAKARHIPDGFTSAPEAAKAAGVLSSTVTAWADDGLISYVKWGRHYYVDLAAAKALGAKIATTSPSYRIMHRYSAFGEEKTLTEWSRDPRCVVSRDTLSSRVQGQKWDLARAMTTPKGHLKSSTD